MRLVLFPRVLSIVSTYYIHFGLLVGDYNCSPSARNVSSIASVSISNATAVINLNIVSKQRLKIFVLLPRIKLELSSTVAMASFNSPR